MTRSNLIPNAFIWENLEMFIFLYVKVKLIIFARYVQPNETMVLYTNLNTSSTDQTEF